MCPSHSLLLLLIFIDLQATSALTTCKLLLYASCHHPDPTVKQECIRHILSLPEDVQTTLMTIVQSMESSLSSSAVAAESARSLNPAEQFGLRASFFLN
jgi:hypothetical protein